MMNNMFSMFDPSSFYMNMAWIPILLTITMFKAMKYKKSNSNKSLKTMEVMMKILMMEIEKLMSKKFKKMSSIMMKNMFLMVMMLNMLALFPFNFTVTAHPSLILTLSLSLWASIMLYSWVKSFKHMLTHLTPMGTPNALMNFMVIIEMVSNIIRPITLSVRLSANMVAGHLLILLLSSFSLTSKMTMTSSSFVLLTLMTLEVAVSMIQAYVISVLVTLYQNESMK